MACVILGRVADALWASALVHAAYREIQDDSGLLSSLAVEGVSVLLPFLLDDRAVRRRHDAAMTAAARQVEARFGAVPPNVNDCPLLIAEGRWEEARALWVPQDEEALSVSMAWNRPHIGAMARAQGECGEAWALVREGLPDGLLTDPGTAYFTAFDLHCLAARLALDDGDYAQARQWLEAHDCWLDWAGPEVCWGRADGQLAWAEYHRALGKPEPAPCRAGTDGRLHAAPAPHPARLPPLTRYAGNGSGEVRCSDRASRNVARTGRCLRRTLRAGTHPAGAGRTLRRDG